MLIIGHRGCFYERENTIKSFLRAFELGADGVELDVQKTIDGVLLVSHDPNLKRVYGIDFDIRKNYFKSIQDLNLQDGIPTLISVLEIVKEKKKFVDIEIKNREDFSFLIPILKKFNYKEILISSFYHKEIFEFKKCYPQFKFAYLYVHVPKDINDFIKEVDFLKPNINYLVEEYKNFSKNIIPWVANEKEEINLVKDLDTFGVITDFPDRFKKESINENINLLYFQKILIKDESFIKNDEMRLTLLNSLGDLTIEFVKINDNFLNLKREFPFIWRINEKIKIDILNFSHYDKITFKIKEFGLFEFKIEDLIKILS